ncbi:substrate-binding domain-containing protein [Roseibium sediminicola]|uniref:Substrate-binding domain-containing protein n=1 Tax=Roseibium sediminicola TaxID=2933272 RepID=A0ABT0GVR4_9HYPH|nr:substrate-binding domain-containing protein [Roseibium sp. CAU 1639]MCK7613305.1 substrate-binding domain-containing protein [Roseibium sp. CAU 1639]
MKGLCLALVLLLVAMPAHAKGKRFAIIPHSVTDGNFIAAFEGVKQAAEIGGDEVFFLGAPDIAHALGQIQALQQALDLNVDGIGFAPLNAAPVLQSPVFEELRRRGIPLVLFESDFPQEHRIMREGFVGTDGVEMGRALGRLAKRLHPGGGEVLIIAGEEGHESINRRIQGVRQALGLRADTKGASLWRENARSPLYSGGDYDLALQQVKFGLENPDVDIVIAAGWWPQMAKNYKQVINPFQKQLASGKKIIISGDASKLQLDYLALGLSQGNVAQNFFAMGQQVYWSLVRLSRGERLVQDTFFTPVRVHMASCGAVEAC